MTDIPLRQILRAHRFDATDGQALFSALLPLIQACCAAPSALIVMLEGQVSRVLSSAGWQGPLVTPRELSLSAQAVAQGRLLEVADLASDTSAGAGQSARVIAADGDAVSAVPARFYAAQPIVSAAGLAYGAICVADSRPRVLDEMQKRALQALATMALKLFETRQDERLRERAAALAATQAQVLALAAQGRPLADLLAQLTQLIESHTDDLLVAVMLSADDGQRLNCVAGATLPPDYRALLDGTEVGPGHGSSGTAAYRREPVLVEDIAHDPLWQDYRELALEHGLRACWSWPILGADGALLGVLSAYCRVARAPRQDEQALLSAVSATAALLLAAVQRERQLEQAQQQSLQVQALARIGTWVYDLRTTTLSVSPVTCEIMGLDPALCEISVQDYISVVHPADRLYVWRECFNALAAGEALTLAYRMRQRDGQVRHVEGRSQPLYDVAGRLSGFTGLLVDLTERQQAQRELRLHQQAMAASNNAVMIVDATDAELPLIHVNPSFEKLTGYSRAEVLGRNGRFLQGHEVAQVGLLEIRAAVAEVRYGSALLRNYRKDGTPFWAELRIAPIRDDAGRATHFVGYLMDVSRRILDQENLIHQAMHDPLTGLPNRNLLQDRLEQAIALARGGSYGVGLAFIDLDRFKRINDSLGHGVGDELLQLVAQRLQAAARVGDTVARFGGDEFVVIAPGMDRAGMMQIVERIEQAVSAPVTIQDKVLDIRTSIGVTLYPGDGENATELLKHADAAMYFAKAAGRAQAHFFDPSISSTAMIKFELEAELVRAIRDQEFVLYYQPEIDARSGLLCGFEALIRWQHPVRGLMMPNEFIALAEESGLIEQIGEWVLRSACAQNKLWLASGFAEVPMAINVSRVQCRNQRFAGLVDSVLRATGLPPELLCLEITESMVMEDSERFSGVLQTVRSLGVRIAIDDFGTGYSSLSLIKQLPIDILKIDRTFVRDLSTDPADASICRTIIAMAQDLQLAVVAEGVESEEQMRFLQQSGCDILQGYLICMPRPVAEIEAFVRTGWNPERVCLPSAVTAGPLL